MASMPDSGMPGDDAPAVDQGTVDQVNSAINQGYSYADISAFHTNNNLPQPPRPSLDAIAGGLLDDPSQWQHAQYGGESSMGPAPDLPLGGAGPIGEALMMGAAGAVPGIIRGVAEGVVEGVLTDIAGAQANLLSRAAQLGVETTTEGLQGAMSPADLAIRDVVGTTKDTLNTMFGNKIVRRVGAAAAAEGAFNNPTGRGAR